MQHTHTCPSLLNVLSGSKQMYSETFAVGRAGHARASTTNVLTHIQHITREKLAINLNDLIVDFLG